MRYLIDFYNSATDAEISQYMADNNCTVLKEWDNFEKEFLVECNLSPPKTSIVEHLADDEDVLAIKPLDVTNINYNFGKSVVPGLDTVTINTTDTNDWWKNYVLESPVFDQPTTTISRKGSTIPVYVMDSGIKADHPDFVGVTISNIWSVFPGDFTDTGGHGTAMASVISGRTAGLCDSPLKIVKIFGANHMTLQSEFVSACNAIMNDFAPNSLAILSCSFVMPRNLYIENKLRELSNAGIFVVCAAGNNGVSIEDLTPACMPEALTIGAYNQNLEPCDFSNYTGELSTTTNVVNHGELDAWAPGENIRVASINGNYNMASGTSIATAIASGVLAYDLHDFIDTATGKIILGYHAMPFLPAGHVNGNYASFMNRRDALLDLSDPKYASSTNKIVTIVQSLDNAPSNRTGITDYIKWVVRVGDNYAGPNTVDRYSTSSIEILEPLPNGFGIANNSQLYGTPTPEQGPSAGEDYKLYTGKIKCNYLDGTSEEKIVEIYVVPGDINMNNISEDSPIYILQSSFCSGQSVFCGPAIGALCVSFCSYQCCDITFKGAPCQCS